MAKYWLSLLKKIFGSDIKSKSGKKERRRWVFGRVKSKRLPTLIAPPPLKEKTLSEAEEEHSRHALAVAIATAAAAEAAVAAAHAAAEVVRLTGTPKSSHRGSEKMSQEWAAITIQTAFRGYLARKALRALKGLVRLQALVRGRSVRRQAITTLKGLQSLIKIQSQVRANRLRMGEETPSCKEIAQVDSKTNESEDAKARLEPHSRKKWDGRSLPKEEIDAMFLSRQEAASKREQAIEYILSHQERINSQSSTTSMTAKQEPNKLNWRWSWLEQWVDNQPWKREVLEKQFPLPSLDQSTNDQAQHRIDEEEETQLRKIEFKNEQFVLSQSPILLPRKSFHLTKCSSIRDDESFSISPTVPSYMAATESAKAKARSISTPKQRLGPLDTYLDHNSPSKNRLSSFPSISSDNGISIGKPPGCQQRSPRLKGLSGPVRSQQRTSKDISIESECSLLNWGQHRTFR